MNQDTSKKSCKIRRQVSGIKVRSMKALVVYDSMYGNTARIAEAVVRSLSRSMDVLSVRAGEFRNSMLESVDLLVVGSPTHGGRPTPKLQAIMERFPENSLGNIEVASFDTRFNAKDHNVGLQILMKAIGYAAEKILKKLVSRGGDSISEAEGFIVEDKEGPLKDGEIERAERWAESLCIPAENAA